VDVVYVASPHPYHRSHALLALNAGKHVLVEKPFAMNAREAKEIVETAKEQELVVLEAMWTRHLPHMARVRSIINAGTLGQVRKVVASHNQSLPRDPRNRLYDPALGGGALLDLGIYPVGLAFDLLGTPSSIQASASMTATGVDRQTTAIFQYDNGQQALLDCDLDAAGANRAVIIGTEGWIDIDSIWYTPTSFTVYDTDGRVMERFHQPVAGRGMQFQAMTMERLIRGDSSAHAEPIAVMHAMDEIRRQIGLIYAADAPTPAAPTLDMSPGIHR
jgi:predicted dehydrogenase